MKENGTALLQLASHFPRVLSLVWQANPRYALATLLLTAMGALAVPAQIWLIKVIIDRVNAMLRLFTESSAIDWTYLAGPMAALFAILIAGDLSRSVADHLQSLLGFHTATYADYLILQKAARLDIVFYESPAFYDQLDRARQDTWRAANLARMSIDILAYGLSTVSILTLLARIHPLTVVVFLLVSAPHLVLKSRYANQLFGLMNLLTPARRMVHYLTGLLLSREAIKEVWLFGLETPFLERFRVHWRTFLDEYRQIIFAQERYNVLLSILSLCGTGAIWAYAIVQTVLNRISIGDLALAFQAVEQARRSMGELFRLGGMYYEHSLFVGNLFDFLNIRSDSVEGVLRGSGASGRGTAGVPRPLQQGIELRNVSFHYPGSEEFVLRNVSFSILPGQTVALVGANGAGKTTLVKLLARFYDPTEGEILLDGRDLREYELEDLRRSIGVIFQDFVRYHLSVQENIGFGQIEHVQDLERVADAAQKGGAVDVIDKLPQGYATLLGKTFEGSVDLSGGEWQKLALGRAFMRASQLLILDEPTAALDALAEYDVYKRFAELTAGKITIFISHRFSTVRMAQQIVVLQDGQVTEMGSHAELMALNKHYAQMYSVQAERYR